MPIESIVYTLSWVAVKEFRLSYQNPEAILFTTYPYYGNLDAVPEQQDP